MLYKKNLIATLIDRGFRISSSYAAFHKEVLFLKNILLQNGYPLKFIEQQIKKTLSKFFPSNDDVASQSTSQSMESLGVPTEVKPLLFVTYFLGSHSEVLSKDLRSLMKKYLPQFKLRIIYKSGSVIGDLFGFKDKLPLRCMSHFIYKYTCEGCNAFYIGKSYRQYKVRVFEHLGKSFRTGNLLGKPKYSDIREHCLAEDHPVKLSNFSIIDRCRFKNDLPILESLHQKIKKPTIGTHEQSTPLLCFEQ